MKNNKIKYPQKIAFSNTEFEIKKDKKAYGSCFDFAPEETENLPHITIGTKDPSEYAQFGGIVHELAELAAVKNFLRGAVSSDTNSYLFACTHEQFNIWMEDLTLLLWQFLK